MKLQSMQQNPPIITKNRKEIARNIRTFSRQNEDGTSSTHLMESGEGGGKYKYQVNPTIFPNKDSSWTDLGGKGLEAYEEAKKRGEVFGFKNKRRAERFAHGSWKKGQDRINSMKSLRNEKQIKNDETR
jgi:hypothetical protein